MRKARAYIIIDNLVTFSFYFLDKFHYILNTYFIRFIYSYEYIIFITCNLLTSLISLLFIRTFK